MRKLKDFLLLKVVIAIILGLSLSLFLPLQIARVFMTFNQLFGNYLSFIIPMLIIGLIVPGIADIGKKSGRLLIITLMLAFGSTLLSGFFSYFVTSGTIEQLLNNQLSLNINKLDGSILANSFFNLEITPFVTVTSALVLSFIMGLGISYSESKGLHNVFSEFRTIIMLLINKTIVPLLPIFIFGIFLKIGIEGEAKLVLVSFFRLILLIFVMHIILLISQFVIAGIITKRNPIKLLLKMLPAYFTALGTQSSAATIPVTLKQAKLNGIKEDTADFVIPLCATIHLSGSMLKIVSTAVAVMYLSGMDYSFERIVGFIFMLAITMVAAPGVPGGAIMAAIAILQSILGFDQDAIGLMIALYIAMDSFGTAANVTGDGAIAMIVNKYS